METILEVQIRYKLQQENYKWGFYYAQCHPKQMNVVQVDFIVKEGNIGKKGTVKWHIISAFIRNKQQYSINGQTYDTPPFDIPKYSPFAVVTIVGEYIYIRIEKKKDKSAALIANVDGKSMPLFGMTKWRLLPKEIRETQQYRPFVIFVPDPQALPMTCFLPSSSFPGVWDNMLFQFYRDLGKDSIGVSIPKAFYMHSNQKIASAIPTKVECFWNDQESIPAIQIKGIGSSGYLISNYHNNETFTNLLSFLNSIGYMVTGVVEVESAETYGPDYLLQITSPESFNKNIIIFLQNLKQKNLPKPNKNRR